MSPYRLQQTELEVLPAATASVKVTYGQLLHELIASCLLLVMLL